MMGEGVLSARHGSSKSNMRKATSGGIRDGVALWRLLKDPPPAHQTVTMASAFVR